MNTNLKWMTALLLAGLFALSPLMGEEKPEAAAQSVGRDVAGGG